MKSFSGSCSLSGRSCCSPRPGGRGGRRLPVVGFDGRRRRAGLPHGSRRAKEPRRHHHGHRHDRAGRSDRRRRPGAGADPQLRPRRPQRTRVARSSITAPREKGPGLARSTRRSTRRTWIRPRPPRRPPRPPTPAKANLAKSEANRDRLAGRLPAGRQFPRRGQPRSTIVADKAAYDVAVADVKLQTAAIDQARPASNRPRPTSRWPRPTSTTAPSSRPVDGVIIDRRVNVGQTVVASLSAPACSCWPRT